MSLLESNFTQAFSYIRSVTVRIFEAICMPIYHSDSQSDDNALQEARERIKKLLEDQEKQSEDIRDQQINYESLKKGYEELDSKYREMAYEQRYQRAKIYNLEADLSSTLTELQNLRKISKVKIPSKRFQIFVRYHETFVLEVEANYTIGDVKRMIFVKEQVQPERIKLIYSGRNVHLDDYRTLNSHHIEKNSTLFMDIRAVPVGYLQKCQTCIESGVHPITRN